MLSYCAVPLHNYTDNWCTGRVVGNGVGFDSLLLYKIREKGMIILLFIIMLFISPRIALLLLLLAINPVFVLLWLLIWLAIKLK